MSRNVLFADDDKVMLMAVEKRFAVYRDTFSMIKAHDGFEAVKKLKEHPISLIVLDLKMPRMDGMSLLTHTREKYPDIPVIIVSGYRTAEMYKLAKAKGVIAYISKPFQVDELGKMILGTLQKEANGGIMHKVSPPVFLQLMEMEEKTCTIRITNQNSSKGGILYFKDGILLDGRVGELQGIEAAYQIFSWDDVTMYIQNDCPDRKNVINSDLQPIIMKAVGMKDEAEDRVSSTRQEKAEPIRKQTSAELERRSGLKDIVLPDDFSLEDEAENDLEALLTGDNRKKSSPGEKGVHQRTGAEDTARRQLANTVKQLLFKSFGNNSGIVAITETSTMENTITFLNELGDMFDLGRLKVGYIRGGDEQDQKYILPGNPTVVLKANQRCPHDKMIRVLSDLKR